jgi:hypothetical protein
MNFRVSLRSGMRLGLNRLVQIHDSAAPQTCPAQLGLFCLSDFE